LYRRRFEGGQVPNLIDLVHGISIFALLTMIVPLAAFALGLSYAVRPSEHKLLLMRPLSLAAIFATVSGLFSGWIVVLGGVAATPQAQLDPGSAYRGIAETLVLGFVCFGLLAAAWLMTAVGMIRRHAG
jgi:hypothetical protein